MTLKAKNGDIEYFKKLIEKNWNPNCFDKNSNSILKTSIYYKQTDLVKFLLDNGASSEFDDSSKPIGR